MIVPWRSNYTKVRGHSQLGSMAEAELSSRKKEKKTKHANKRTGSDMNGSDKKYLI